MRFYLVLTVDGKRRMHASIIQAESYEQALAVYREINGKVECCGMRLDSYLATSEFKAMLVGEV